MTLTNCSRCFRHTPGVLAHSVRVVHGKDQPTLKIESRYTKESAIASRICTQCSVASGIFITNQKRLVTVSHLLESLPGCNVRGFREATSKSKPRLMESHKAGSRQCPASDTLQCPEGPSHLLRQKNLPTRLDS